MSNLALETLLAGAYGGQGGSGGSGGGSGTTNYNDLSNRPKINGVTLSGDKSASDLGIAEYDDTALDARVTAVETALTGKADTSDIPDVSGKANTSDLATVATSGSYNDLSNKPTIPSAYDDTALTERVSDLETDVNDLKTNGASVTVDSTLSDTSENPVQNKVIKAALDGKQAAGGYVTTPYDSSWYAKIGNCGYQLQMHDKDGDYALVMNIRQDQKNLKLTKIKKSTGETVDTITFTADEDTGWQTLASGVYYRKKNGMVTISMSNNSQAQTATETAVATLPEGCRPSRQIIAVGVTNQFAQYLGISVNTNGEIRTRTATGTGTGFYGSVSFPV